MPIIEVDPGSIFNEPRPIPLPPELKPDRIFTPIKPKPPKPGQLTPDQIIELIVKNPPTQVPTPSVTPPTLVVGDAVAAPPRPEPPPFFAPQPPSQEPDPGLEAEVQRFQRLQLLNAQMQEDRRAAAQEELENDIRRLIQLQQNLTQQRRVERISSENRTCQLGLAAFLRRLNNDELTATQKKIILFKQARVCGWDISQNVLAAIGIIKGQND